MTCHQCGWSRGSSALDDKFSECPGCGEWFCEFCVDSDSHGCECLRDASAKDMSGPWPDKYRCSPLKLGVGAALGTVVGALVGWLFVGCCG